MVDIITIIAILVIIVALFIISCFVSIGPKERGLLTKKFGAPLPQGDIIAFNGEAGYQANLVQPGWRFILKPIYSVMKIPLVQTTANGGGIIISQIGKDIPTGFINATGEGLTLDDFRDPKQFLAKNGEKGIQRIMLPVSTSMEIHPIAFLVKTTQGIYGKPLTQNSEEELQRLSPELVVINGGK
jgi:uncharacterized membrane protein YqiK